MKTKLELTWIGKENRPRLEPRILLEDPSNSCHAAKRVTDHDIFDNRLIFGDNLLALKALEQEFTGKIKCIYIDPPYNTGVDERDDTGKRSGWIFSDNVNSPEIRRWLGQVVGEEAEDLSRHDKWLCMMYPRLSLLHQFLREDGVIFASIDEIEVASLRILFDEIFGASNRVGTIIWKNATDNNYEHCD